MANSEEKAVQNAIIAYRTGDRPALIALMHDEVWVSGSEGYDNWPTKAQAERGLKPELVRHKSIDNNVSGYLVEEPVASNEFNSHGKHGNVAIFERTGHLKIDGIDYPDAQWRCVVKKHKGDWLILNSHFLTGDPNGSVAS